MHSVLHSVLVAQGCRERRPGAGAFDAIERQLARISEVQDREVKQHEAVGESGVVARMFRQQNYGFIEVKDAPELYFTRNAVIGMLSTTWKSAWSCR